MDLVSSIGGGGSTAGWSKLGATLGGMGQNNERALVQGQTAGVTLTSKLLDAKKKRDEALALEQLEADLVKNGVDPKQAGIIGAATRSGSSFTGSASGAGHIQNNGIKQQALAAAIGAPGQEGQAATAPDMELVNRIMTVVSGKPQPLTKIEGNNVINPMVAPGSQEISVAPYGEKYLEMTERAKGLTTRAQAETTRGRASYGRTGPGAKASDPAKAQETAIKEAASNAFYEARANGDLPVGTTIKDVEYQLRTRGKWTDPDGKVRATAAISGDELMGDPATQVSYDGPDLVTSIGSGAPKSDAQAAVRDSARRAGANSQIPVADFSDVRATVPTTGIPSEAAARLREGVVTRFGNGQAWTLQGGRPVQVK